MELIQINRVCHSCCKQSWTCIES